jgi:predicted extracellular nuclease
LTICIDAIGQIKDRPEQLFMFWNVENFFDWTDQGTGESDAEFSSMGSRRWTRKKFYAKCDALAKTLLWIGDSYGRLPDVIGLAEVENRRVLQLLLESSLLRKCGYEIVHHDSGDRRGIDVALLYRNEVYDLSESFITTPQHKGEKLSTRDILTVRLRRKTDGEQITFIVNHHPSKYGGSKASEERRESVMINLSKLCDSLLKTPENKQIVAMGDFNDYPDGSQFSIVDGIMVNKGLELHQKGEGTIRYEGKWDLIDMFMVSPALKESSVMEIVRVPFLMTREKKHPGEKPFRTYSGPRYIGGVSDHCPVVLLIDE